MRDDVDVFLMCVCECVCLVWVEEGGGRMLMMDKWSGG